MGRQVQWAEAGPLLVAVDGGGSRTRLWLLDAGGRLLGRAEAGSSNLTAAGVEAAARAVAGAAGQVLPDSRPVAVAVLALAGADREPEATRMRARMEALFPGTRLILVHDGIGALMAGTLGEPGLLLAAGTGSLALAVGPDGREVRAGGWGYLLGDEGSGYWIGREAIRAALRAEDGRGEPTALAAMLREVAGVPEPSGLVGPIHRGERDRAWVAGLAGHVLAAADAGDPAAARILDRATEELALLVRAVLDRASFLEGIDPVPVVAAGGLFRLGVSWWARVESALARIASRARLTRQVQEPAAGAAYLALRALHGRVPGPALERLRLLGREGPGGSRDDTVPGGVQPFQPV